MSTPEQSDPPLHTQEPEIPFAQPLASATDTPKRVSGFIKLALAGLIGAGGGVGYSVYQAERFDREQEQAQKRMDEMGGVIDGHKKFLNEHQQQLNEQVTMNDLREAIDMIKSAAVRVEGPSGLGSGWITKDNLGRLIIVTNAHVTEENEFRRGFDPHDFRDGVYHIKMYNGDDFEKPVEFDAAPVILANGKRAHSFSDKRDIAVLRLPPEIERDILAGKIKVTPVTIANTVTNPLRVGDPVVAVGNPFGERDSASHGIITHTQRWGDIEPENVFIQTNAPLNPGNSGCEVARVRKVNGKVIAEVVGMHTWGYRGGDGVGGAIHSRVIKLQLEDCGFPVTTPEELAAYNVWWKATIEPEMKKKLEELNKKTEQPQEGALPAHND